MQTPEEFVKSNDPDKILTFDEIDDRIKLIRARDAEWEASLRARDAKIRRECAERAITWLKTLHHEPEPGLPWSEKIKRMQELQIKTLIAAIIGEEE